MWGEARSGEREGYEEAPAASTNRDDRRWGSDTSRTTRDYAFFGSWSQFAGSWTGLLTGMPCWGFWT